ncbi:MAG: TraB/GumN family protein [Cytophagaceae bacterium]|nr:TraB/GumN family protein [Cytophagaceae bacterium]
MSFRKALAVNFLMGFIFIHISPNEALSQTGQKYQGLLWEITGNGLKKPSYLYGTMHVSNKVAFRLSDTFFLALKNCDMVALEINPETFMEDLLNSSYMSEFKSSGFSFRDYDNFYESAFSASIPDNKKLAGILSKDHNFANYLLYRSMYTNENFEENTYLDLFIFQAGKKLNKKVYGLEDVNTTLELSMKSYMPEEGDEEEEEPQDYMDYYDDREDGVDNIEDAYRKGDLDILDSLTKKRTPKKFIKYMLYYRNELMADKMDSLMKHNSLFTGIGAAHLPGEKGVIELLRKKGYTVRPVVTVNKTSAKMRDKIDNTVYKLSYSNQSSGDSAFRCNLPSKMVEHSSYSEYTGSFRQEGYTYKEYFCPEMVNGAYYTITRMNTYAPLEDVSPEYILKRIDSLLYENIPGKILKKKAITHEGMPGYDIINKTRRGDLQRYKIFVSPLELYVFKLSGVGDFVNVEGEKFFSSISVKNKQVTGWSSFTPKSGGFKLSMPGQMVIEDNVKETSSKRQYFIQSYDEANKDYFMFMKAVYHDMNYIEEDSFELSYMAKKFYEQFDYKLASKKHTTVNGYPALDLQVKKEKADDMFLRMVIVGPNYYLLASKTNDKNIADKFLNSFSVAPIVYSKPFEEYKDTTLFFTVKTNVKPSGESALKNKYLGIYNFKKEKKGKEKKYVGDHNYVRFSSPETSELIGVSYTRYHEYSYYKDHKVFWETAIQHINYDSSFIVRRSDDAKDPNVYEVLLMDTNSTRVIKVKMILKEGVLYSLYTNIDSIGKESAFVKTFYETFSLSADTAIGVSVFKDKKERFFSLIMKEDTASYLEAMDVIDMIRFEDKDAEKLIEALESNNIYQYAEEKDHDKLKLIKELGYLKNKKTLAYFEKIYPLNSDSALVQVEILTSLAKNKSAEANALFLKLLKQEVPLADQSEIDDIFYFFKDSLKVASSLYPDLMYFTRYEEYRANIYELLAVLADSNYVKPELYAPFKAEILREANNEVKRKIAAAGSDRRYDSDYDDYRYMDVAYGVGSVAEDESIPYITDKLQCYAILLVPFHKEEPVKKLFDKIKKIKEEEVQLNMAMLFLKNKLEVNDTIWTHFSKSTAYRIDLYERLKTAQKVEKFDKKYLTQDNIAKALLYSQSNAAKKDSIVFLEKRKLKVQGKEGYVYFYKRKNENSKRWRLDYVGLQPEDTSKFNMQAIVTEKGVKFKDKEVKEAIDKEVEALALLGRKRASRSSFRKSSYDLYGDED